MYSTVGCFHWRSRLLVGHGELSASAEVRESSEQVLVVHMADDARAFESYHIRVHDNEFDRGRARREARVWRFVSSILLAAHQVQVQQDTAESHTVVRDSQKYVHSPQTVNEQTNTKQTSKQII